MLRQLSACLLLAPIWVWAADSPSLSWPQFRGPGGKGVGDDRAALPSEFGPDKNVVWKTPLPSGHGSPCIWGDRIFVTSYDASKQLLEVDIRLAKITKVSEHKLANDFYSALRSEAVHFHSRIAYPHLPIIESLHWTECDSINRLPALLLIWENEEKCEAGRQTEFMQDAHAAKGIPPAIELLRES